MLSSFLEALNVIALGVMGIGLSIFWTLRSVTEANDNLDFFKIAKPYFRKTAPAWISSTLAVIIYTAVRSTLSDWFPIDEEDPSWTSRLLAAYSIMGGIIGFGVQHGYYKFALRKVDKKLKAWEADESGKACPEEPSENTIAVKEMKDDMKKTGTEK